MPLEAVRIKLVQRYGIVVSDDERKVWNLVWTRSNGVFGRAGILGGNIPHFVYLETGQ
jgi:hypothetical protein